jgi:hypothetical protein
VGIRRRQRQQRGVERDLSPREQRGDIGQEDGHEVSVAALDGGAHRRAGEQRDGPESIAVSRSDEWRRPCRVQVIERHVTQVRALRQRFDQRRRRRGRTVHEQRHPARNRLHRVSG